MPLFRKKSIVVDAQQIVPDELAPKGVETGCSCLAGGGRCTLCGEMWVRDGSGRQLIVHVGDWIVPEKDGSGFYPVAGALFADLFEPAEPKTSHEKQYRYEVLENGAVIDSGKIDDPFVRTKLLIKGWRSAWQVLRRGLNLRVCVDGSRESYRVIFQGDYTPQAQSPQREQSALELGAACRAAGPSESY